MAGHVGPKAYMGWWGSMGGPVQKRVTSYTISPYVGKPFKGALYNAIFNTARRTRNQMFYILFPAAIVWKIWVDARDYNEFLYTKEGREELEIVNV